MLDQLVCKYNRDGLAGLIRGSIRFPLQSGLTYLQWRRRYAGKTDAQPGSVIWADPQSIEEVAASGIFPRTYGKNIDEFQRPAYLEWADAGDVLRGEWDYKRVQFADIAEYRAIEHRFIHDGAWEETALYRHALSRIRSGSPAYDARTEAELNQHFQNVETLYQSIRDDGYRRNSVATSGRDRPHHPPSIDEVTVNIGRSGDLLYHNRGRHRLAIAQLLNVDVIPVLVHVRHERWQHLRDRILTAGQIPQTDSRENGTQIHPDLRELLRSSCR